MRCILFILSLFLSFAVNAADTVRINNPTNMSISGFTDASVTLTADAPSGDATTETAPAKIYIPIARGAVNLTYSLLDVGTLFNTATATHVVTYPLLVTTGGTAQFLYAAVKIGTTDYFAVAKSASINANQTNVSFSFNLSPLDICKGVAGAGSTSCTNLLFASTTETTIKPKVYFFLSSDGIDVTGSTTVDPTAYTGGVFFESQMSNRVYTSAQLLVSLSNLRVGDRRLIGEFDASSTMDSALFKKVIAFSYTDTTVDKAGGGVVTYKTLVGFGDLIGRDISTAQSGQFTLNELVNNTDYNIAIAFLDKFQFATTFSASKRGTPLEIQELLKKEACFLLTAGFGEEHYVITYFRKYRDQVLADSWLGRKFIKVYYRAAPHYAEIIYRSEALRWGIRAAAYILYFFFNYYWLVLFIGASCYYLNIRKNKLLLQNNSL
ncbi:MAG: CFI-box-CTERM domain-containing protein [Bacteriovorax sp.]|jgi:hypothetical protein